MRWMLIVLWLSNEMTVEVMPTELACDTQRLAVVKTAIAAEHTGTYPKVIGVQCVYGLVTDEFITEGQ
jgi:hypothetical protein